MMSYNVPLIARNEIKFVARTTEYNRIINWLKLHSAGFYKLYPDRVINNVYFDTQDYNAYAGNISGES